jgi:hypothetical protein
VVPVSERALVERYRHALRLTGRKSDFLEALELFHGALDVRGGIANIDLRDFGTST